VTHKLLTDYLAAVSAAGNEDEILKIGTEQAVDAVTAHAGGIVDRGRARASATRVSGEVPSVELLAVCAGGTKAPVPGFGLSPAIALELDQPEQAHLVVVRAGAEFSDDERDLLQGMARVLSLVIAGFRTRAQERRLNAELHERQTQLQRFVRLTSSISHGAPLEDILNTIVLGAAELLDHDVVALRLVDPDDPDEFQVVAFSGVTDDGNLASPPASYGVGGRAIVENSFVADEDLSNDPTVSAMFAGRVLRRAMAAPIHDQGKAIGSVAAASFVGRPYTPLDRELLEAFADYASLAVSDSRRVAATRHQALHDDLTTLPNRALFLDRLAHALARREQRGGEVAVLFCDVDHFKQVNDRLGHNIGDEMLRAVAHRIVGCLRTADTAARLGGDEFAILLEDSTPEEAERVAERILATFRTGVIVRGRELPVGTSIGVALSSNSADPEDLLRYSDVAMYRAKAKGRGRYEVFDASMWSDVVTRAELESDLRRSVSYGEQQDLAVVYQPILDLATLDLVAVEALARWRHPDRGEIEPDLFLAVAEEAGLILDLGRAVLRKACAQAREWRDRLGLEVSITVNISAHQLEDMRLVDHIVAAVNDSGIEPHQLMLEIKESVVMQAAGPDASDRLLALKAIGVRIAIDGFGTGYSSLGYLKRLPVDALKIDKTLVHDVERSSRDLALVRTVVSLGETLGLDMIAEGIETVAQLKALRRIGCGQGQGFHLAAPMTAAELERILPGSFGQPMRVPSPR